MAQLIGGRAERRVVDVDTTAPRKVINHPMHVDRRAGRELQVTVRQPETHKCRERVVEARHARAHRAGLLVGRLARGSHERVLAVDHALVVRAFRLDLVELVGLAGRAFDTGDVGGVSGGDGSDNGGDNGSKLHGAWRTGGGVLVVGRRQIGE
jgi:hypothetical protein